MKVAPSICMKPDHYRILLFLLCAVVLLGAGFAWGYGNAYGRFYSPDATLDRELVQLDFDSRVLHYVNVGQRAECRRDLVTQMQHQIAFLRGMLSSASAEARSSADHDLQQAEAVIKGQTLGEDGVARAGEAGR